MKLWSGTGFLRAMGIDNWSEIIQTRGQVVSHCISTVRREWICQEKDFINYYFFDPI